MQWTLLKCFPPNRGDKRRADRLGHGHDLRGLVNLTVGRAIGSVAPVFYEVPRLGCGRKTIVPEGALKLEPLVVFAKLGEGDISADVGPRGWIPQHDAVALVPDATNAPQVVGLTPLAKVSTTAK
jgi:hypothetical protein